jgi:hypothetical protein
MENLKTIQKLKKVLKEEWPLIVEKYNNHISENFESLFLKNFKSYFTNKKTQEKTKIVSPIFNSILCKHLKTFGFLENEIDGSDYLFENLDLEGKLTMTDNNTWTGNGYKKTNWHLLKKIIIDDNGMITKSSCYLFPLDESTSYWSVPKNSNFSNFKINSEDLDKLVVVYGDVDLSKKRKYIQPILK